MKKELIYLLLVIFSIGCTNNNIEKRIGKKVDKECDTAKCMIAITQLTDFKWDKMYVFNNPSSLEVINQAIGMKYPYYVEFSREIIFLNKGKIVHYENNGSNIDQATDGQVIFDYPDSLKYKVYTPSKSIFNVKRKTSKDISYFVLYQ